MEQFYKIGRGVLLQAIGLKRNTKYMQERKEYVIDEENTGCGNCLFKQFSNDYQLGCDTCKRCHKIVYKEITKSQTIYDNEKNRYGTKEPLTLDAAKIFILLHTLKPDAKGFVKEVIIRDMEESAHCTRRTVYNCLKQLQEKGYISYSRYGCGTYMVHLSNYADYFKDAIQGGRGYITLSTSTLKELMSMESLLSFRLSLRTYIDIAVIGKEKSSFNVITKTYKDMRLSLPKYCKPNIIVKSLHKCFSIFQYEIMDNGIRFYLPDAYNAKKKYPEQVEMYRKKWTLFIKNFNTEIPKLNTNKLLMEHCSFQDFFEHTSLDLANNYHVLAFHEEQFNSLIALSMEYSYTLVYEALKLYYASYVMPRASDRIHTFGGLMRHLVREVLKKPCGGTQTLSFIPSYSGSL